MKKNVIIYRIVTGLFSLFILAGVGMYFFTHEQAVEQFQSLGFPPYLIYLMGVAKLLGLIAIWTRASHTLKEWAYAGFTFNMLLAISAHINANDGEFGGAALVLALVLISYFLQGKVYSKS